MIKLDSTSADCCHTRCLDDYISNYVRPSVVNPVLRSRDFVYETIEWNVVIRVKHSMRNRGDYD